MKSDALDATAKVAPMLVRAEATGGQSIEFGAMTKRGGSGSFVGTGGNKGLKSKQA